jgi:hypothetical protein
MGLDGVELIMAYEDAFSIEITDADAIKIRTPQDVIELVCSRVELSDESTCLEQAAFHVIRRETMLLTSAERRQIALSTPLSRLFMLTPPEVITRRLSEKLGLRDRLPIDRMTTVGDLVRHVAGSAAFIAKRGKPWTRDEIALVIRQVTLAQLGIAEDEYGVTRRFAEDLGVD